MGAHRKTISEIPAWLKALPGDARLSRTELARVLGYSSAAGITKAIHNRTWPELEEIEIRDIGCGRASNGALRVLCYYRVSDVRRVLRKLIASQK